MTAIHIDFDVDVPGGFMTASGTCEVTVEHIDNWFVSDIWRTEAECIPGKFGYVEHADWPCSYAIPRDEYKRLTADSYRNRHTVTLGRTDPQFRIIADAIERQMIDMIRDKIAEDFPEMDPRSDYEEHAIGVHNAL